MQALCSADAVAGRGIIGDRYYNKRGSFNAPQFDPHVRDLTLLSLDAVTTCNQRLDTHLPPESFRRNLIIRDLDVMTLRGKRFRIGSAVLRGVRTAPPCRYLARLCGEDVMTGLKKIGGIRAVVEQDGRICVGDTVIPLP